MDRRSMDLGHPFTTSSTHLPFPCIYKQKCFGSRNTQNESNKIVKHFFLRDLKNPEEIGRLAVHIVLDASFVAYGFDSLKRAMTSSCEPFWSASSACITWAKERYHGPLKTTLHVLPKRRHFRNR